LDAARARERIRALRALAADSAAAPAEAASALEAAAKLEARFPELAQGEQHPEAQGAKGRGRRSRQRRTRRNVIEVHGAGPRHNVRAPFWCAACDRGRNGPECPVCGSRTVADGDPWQRIERLDG